MIDNPPTRILVIQNNEQNFVRLIGSWLAEVGFDLSVIRACDGEEIPATVDGYAGIIVLGGPQDAHDAPDGTPGAPWFPELKALIRKAVATGMPYLGICLGSQLLAEAMGGRVTRCAAGPEYGARLIAKRDAAATDRLFAAVPLIADVLQWHRDEVVALPAGATVLAGSPHSQVQAFRIGATAWGLQFHYEYDASVIDHRISSNTEDLRKSGFNPDEVHDAMVARLEAVRTVWRPFTQRFGSVCREHAAARTQALRPGVVHSVPVVSRDLVMI